MENFVSQWEALMDSAQTAYVNAHFEHSLALNTSAIALSQHNFPQLFCIDADKAVATVLVSHFSAIDNCKTLANYSQAQQLFNDALHFLHTEKMKSTTHKQQIAIYRGASQIHKEWCAFINTHRINASTLERSQFQTSMKQLLSLNASQNTLH